MKDIYMKDSYMMDMENEALATWYAKSGRGIITGKARCSDKEWIEHIKQYIDFGVKLGEARRALNIPWSKMEWEEKLEKNALIEEEAKRIAVKEYVEWVRQGGGDEWFQDPA